MLPGRAGWLAGQVPVLSRGCWPKVLSAAIRLRFTSTQNANDVAESEYQSLLSRRLRLVCRLGELCSRAYLRVVSNEVGPNPHAPAIFTRPPFSTHFTSWM